MQIENQELIKKLNVLHVELSSLVYELEGELDSSEAIHKIRVMNGLLDSIVIRIIKKQLAEWITFTQANPNAKLTEGRRKQLVDLFEALNKVPASYQPNKEKVKKCVKITYKQNCPSQE